MAETDHDCVQTERFTLIERKVDRGEQKDEFTDKILQDLREGFQKIERHMEGQTAALERLARQEERQNALKKNQEEDRRLIDKLFDLYRSLEKKMDDGFQGLRDQLYNHELDPFKEAQRSRRSFWGKLAVAILDRSIAGIIGALSALAAFFWYGVPGGS